MHKLLVSTVLFVSVVALAACGGSSKSGGTAVGGGNTGDFCTTLKADAAQLDKIGSQANAQQLDAAITDLANKAPTEIKADMAALVAAVRASASFASQLSADPSQAESLASQFSSQTASLETASANITKFAKDKCGIDLNSNSSSQFSSVANSIDN